MTEQSDIDRRVWKYELAYVEQLSHQVPIGGVVVHVAEQHGRPCVWIDVDAHAATEERTFLVRGTGHPVPAEAHWLGTWFVDGGRLVFHLYEGGQTLMSQNASPCGCWLVIPPPRRCPLCGGWNG